MAPRVQAFIQHVQPYKLFATTPKATGFVLLNEMCNIYKHRLIAPVLLSVSDVSIELSGVRCSLTGARTHKVEAPLENDTVFVSFSSPDFGPKSKIQMKAQPTCYIGFPPGTPAQGWAVEDFLNGAIGTVRWIVHETTKLQWGEPLGLWGPEHTLVSPPPHDAPP